MLLAWRDMRRAIACSDPVIGLSDAMLSNQLARFQSQYSGIYTGVILVGSFLVLYAMANTVTFTKGRKGGLNAILHGYRFKKDSKKNDRTYFKKSIWARLSSLGFSEEYKVLGSDVRTWFKKVGAMPFVHLGDVEDAHGKF